MGLLLFFNIPTRIYIIKYVIKMNIYSLRLTLIILLLIVNCNAQSNNEKAQIIVHGESIREAFTAGNIEGIKKLHHPDVIKALGYNNIKVSREEVIEDIRNTLQNYKLEFIENEVEHILIQGDIAIEQSIFSIKGIPLTQGEPFVFSGRTMVTYIKYDQSPTGWATIREIIQVATH